MACTFPLKTPSLSMFFGSNANFKELHLALHINNLDNWSKALLVVGVDDPLCRVIVHQVIIDVTNSRTCVNYCKHNIELNP